MCVARDSHNQKRRDFMLQSTADPAIVRQLETLEEQLASTWKNRDCAGWGGLLADDWTVTHINAQVITKAQALEMCRTGPAVTSSVDQIAVRRGINSTQLQNIM